MARAGDGRRPAESEVARSDFADDQRVRLRVKHGPKRLHDHFDVASRKVRHVHLLDVIATVEVRRSSGHFAMASLAAGTTRSN
jgi:hypothetical protein